MILWMVSAQGVKLQYSSNVVMLVIILCLCSNNCRLRKLLSWVTSHFRFITYCNNRVTAGNHKPKKANEVVEFI